jgi:hypothetical protein
VISVDAVDEILRTHLREEEQNVRPLATGWMSEEEWDQLPGHAIAILSKDNPRLPFGLVREQLAPEVRTAMIKGTPTGMRVAWREPMDPAFVALVAEVRA